MIKTEADLAKLTTRQREVLTAFARQLSTEKASQFVHVAKAITNIDAEALLQAYATVQEVLSRLESSTAPSVSPALTLTGALLDRLTHHVHILEMNGESYRAAQSKRRSRRSRPDTPVDGPASP